MPPVETDASAIEVLRLKMLELVGAPIISRGKAGREVREVLHNAASALDVLNVSRAGLAASLEQAVRYIDVSLAYQGAMTAAAVEQRVKDNASVASTQICANSTTPLAAFDFSAARALLGEKR